MFEPVKFYWLLLLLLVWNSLQAECSMPEAPLIPDGNTASETEMRAAGITVRAYMAEIKDYRYCIKKELDSNGENPPEDDKKRWAIRHNQSVDQEEYVAEMFNAQVRLFKTRENP